MLPHQNTNQNTIFRSPLWGKGLSEGGIVRSALGAVPGEEQQPT